MARAALHGCSCVPADRRARQLTRLGRVGESGTGARRVTISLAQREGLGALNHWPHQNRALVATDGVVLAAGSSAYEHVPLLPKARAYILALDGEPRRQRTHSSASLVSSRPKRSTASRCHLDSIVHALAPKSLLELRAPKAGSESDRADQALTCRSLCPLRLPLSFSRAYLAWLR